MVSSRKAWSTSTSSTRSFYPILAVVSRFGGTQSSKSAYKHASIFGDEDAIRALARAGCVSIEAGVESITEAGRAYLDKKCKLSTDELTRRLVYAKSLVPFVQANLLAMTEDDADAIETLAPESREKRCVG